MRRTTAVVVLGCAATIAVTSVAQAKGSHPAKGPHVCSGTLKSPGVLSGTYKAGVVVKGFCFVNAGPARVAGLLKLRPGSGLAAAFGHRNSHLTVNGDVLVGRGATLVLGCNPKSSPCIDDNMNHPRLASKGRVTGSVTETAPLGVLIHSTTILGNVTETGGGGGLSCSPPFPTPFSQLMSPVFSAYEDSSVRGNLDVTGLHSCWLGVARVRVGGNLRFTNDKLGDPDAIEILGNHVRKDLVCRGNSAVWDSAENPSNPMGALFPRTAQPNNVHGNRLGQCVKSTPPTPGGPSGPGPF
jgi:hypothetical protein